MMDELTLFMVLFTAGAGLLAYVVCLLISRWLPTSPDTWVVRFPDGSQKEISAEGTLDQVEQRLLEAIGEDADGQGRGTPPISHPATSDPARSPG